MSGTTASDYLLRLTLLFGMAIFLAVAGLGYLSGSEPEWIVLKGSIGFASVGAIGWIASLLLLKSYESEGEKGSVGSNVDVTLSEQEPVREIAGLEAGDSR